MLLQFPCGDCVRCNGLFDSAEGIAGSGSLLQTAEDDRVTVSRTGDDGSSKPIPNQETRFVVPEDNRKTRVGHTRQHQIGYLPVDHTLYRISSKRPRHLMASLEELGFSPF